jgi:hypothetical protein
MLTTSQLTTLKSFIVADSGLNSQPNNDTGNAVVAASLNANASPEYLGWRSSVTDAEIMQNGFDWTRVDNLSVGKARVWDWMFRFGSINPSKGNIRAGIAATWTGTQADIIKKWAASSNLAVTALNSLAASSTYVNGWESAVVDNSAGYDDCRVTAKITAGTTLTAGQIRMYLVGVLDDTPSYFPNFDGTESAEAPFTVDTEMQAGIMRLAAAVDTDTTNSDIYYLDCPSAKAIFGGNLPRYFTVAIAQATNAALASSGNQVTVHFSYYNVAP